MDLNFRQLTYIENYLHYREIAIDEVNHLFVSADDDHDDRLSYQEIIENYDVFVGSEATDYGEHLNKIKDEL